MIVPLRRRSDVIARAVAEEMGKSLGVIVIENIAGAGGSTGAGPRAPGPDGYTIAIGSAGTSAATYDLSQTAVHAESFAPIALSRRRSASSLRKDFLPKICGFIDYAKKIPAR